MRDFIAYQIALQAARSLGGCLTAIRKRDRDLERQMRRATQSFVLTNFRCTIFGCTVFGFTIFRVAAGSAAEVMAALELAVAWGYLTEGQAVPAKELLDRLLAVCWRLTERCKPSKEVRRGG